MTNKIELEARELLAAEYEAAGNKPAAFTLREVGPVGGVLQCAVNAITKALTLQPPSTDRVEDGRVPDGTGLSSSTEPQSSQGLGPSGFDPSRVSLDAARTLLVIAQRKSNADDARIRRLEGAVQRMAAIVRPLRSQGEDYIWRSVQHVLAVADAAILDRCDIDGNPKGQDAEERLGAKHDSAVAKPIAHNESIPSPKAGVPSREDVAEAFEQQRRDAASMLSGPIFVESLHKAFDDAGVPRRSEDGKIHYGLLDRIRLLAALIPSTIRNEALVEADKLDMRLKLAYSDGREQALEEAADVVKSLWKEMKADGESIPTDMLFSLANDLRKLPFR